MPTTRWVSRRWEQVGRAPVAIPGVLRPGCGVRSGAVGVSAFLVPTPPQCLLDRGCKELKHFRAGSVGYVLSQS